MQSAFFEVHVPCDVKEEQPDLLTLFRKGGRHVRGDKDESRFSFFMPEKSYLVDRLETICPCSLYLDGQNVSGACFRDFDQSVWSPLIGFVGGYCLRL